MNNVIEKQTATPSQLHPDVVRLVNQVKDKIKNNSGELSTEDLTTGIASSRHLLFNFLMDNNLNNIAATIRTKMREKMDLIPSRAQVEFILSGYISKNEYGKLQQILNDFKFNPDANNYTANPEILNKLLSKLK